MKLLRTKAVTGIVGVLALVAAGCTSTPVHEPSAPRDWYREGTGRTVVMLGGGVYGAAMFAPHARELSSDFEVIRVQTLNVQTAENGAPMPSDYSVTAESSALERTLSIIGVIGRVDLVGASLGAVVALNFAATYPERVRTVTLFEPPAFWILPDEEYERDPVLREMRELTRGMTPSTVPSDDQLFRFRCLLGACPPAIPDHTDAARAEWDVSRRAMRGLSAVPAHREDRARLAHLEAPVLLLTGSETVPFHRRMNDLLAQVLPRVERAELPGGHSAARTASSAFNGQLRGFLERHERTRRGLTSALPSSCATRGGMSTAPPARPGGDVAAADGGVGKPAPEVTAANGNNSAAIGGYDAYFGLYVMDEAAGTVTHMLETALNPAGVGQSLVPQWPLSGDTLVIGFETTGPGGAPLTRVLTWRRER